MKRWHFILLLLALAGFTACSTVSGPVQGYPGPPRPASETAHLRIPAAITVEKIDGQEVQVPSVLKGFNDIYLLPGEHRIDFKYELYWGNNDNGMLVKSDVVGVVTTFKAGMNYDLRYPVPDGEEDAYEKARKFKATLLEKETGRQVVSQSVAELNQLRMSASRAIHRQRLAAKVADTPSSADTSDIAVPMGITAETAAHEDAVKRLKFWWLTASPEERQQFKTWMESVQGIK